jgi:hypothetical protein
MRKRVAWVVGVGGFVGALAALGMACGGIAEGMSGSGSPDASTRSDGGAGSTTHGGGAVDAGYYYGDGSFWVDGGAYHGLGDAHIESGADALIEASPGCAKLAACCPSLVGSSQSVCTLVVSQGDATQCATELSMLEGEGSCTGATVLATNVQLAPVYMVSDGTLLFWVTNGEPGLLAMPVGGGPITALLESTNGGFLAVDDVNVYVGEDVAGDNTIVRLPKDGSPPSLVNESGADVTRATALGGAAYWTEPTNVIATAPLQGDSVTFLWTPPRPMVSPVANASALGVTSGAAFITGVTDILEYAPLAAPAQMPSSLAISGCGPLSSDNAAVYCAQSTGMNIRIANDGTTTNLGAADNSSYFAFDNTYAYWANLTTVGTIMRVPKSGGTATVLARDTSPTAIAVDANNVYWANMSGQIKSTPK